MTATEIFHQSLDKQRILAVGEGGGLIASLITHVLKFNNRKFDSCFPNKPCVLSKDNVICIISDSIQLTDYKHHILILSSATSKEELAQFEILADATPKGGTLIFPESDSALKQLGLRERSDVQAIGYSACKHETKDGKTILISSTNEKFPIALPGGKNLEYLNAAKEVLKKIGITSGQFYNALTSYQPA